MCSRSPVAAIALFAIVSIGAVLPTATAQQARLVFDRDGVRGLDLDFGLFGSRRRNLERRLAHEQAALAALDREVAVVTAERDRALDVKAAAAVELDRLRLEETVLADSARVARSRLAGLDLAIERLRTARRVPGESRRVRPIHAIRRDGARAGLRLLTERRNLAVADLDAICVEQARLGARCSALEREIDRCIEILIEHEARLARLARDRALICRGTADGRVGRRSAGGHVGN